MLVSKLYEDIEKRIKSALDKAEIKLGGDGCNCTAVVISDEFIGLGALNRQRMIMVAVADLIKSGELHALSLKTYTCDEWHKTN